LKITENGTQGKITKYRVIGNIFKPFGYKLWLYFTSFFLQIFLSIYISKLQRDLINGKVPSIDIKLVKILNILRNVHFILFNLILIDGVFYSSRILSHIKFMGAETVGGVKVNSQVLNVFFSYMMFLFLWWDMLKLYYAGISLGKAHNPYHQDETLEHNEVIRLVLVR